MSSHQGAQVGILGVVAKAGWSWARESLARVWMGWIVWLAVGRHGGMVGWRDG